MVDVVHSTGDVPMKAGNKVKAVRVAQQRKYITDNLVGNCCLECTELCNTMNFVHRPY